MIPKANIVAVIIVISTLLFFGLIAYSEYNMDYKYTVEVPCYDKYNSLINDITCSHDVYCGPWQKSTPFKQGSFPCNDANVSDSEAEE